MLIKQNKLKFSVEEYAENLFNKLKKLDNMKYIIQHIEIETITNVKLLDDGTKTERILKTYNLLIYV